MSYLDIYQNTLPPSETIENDTSNSDIESIPESSAVPVQARYRYHNLSSILAEEIVKALSTTQAIDLSFNAIDQIPRTVSALLIALDMSYNAIERPIVLHSGYHLVELNLSNNRIADLKGLALLDMLEFLDVSSNLLSRLEGLENMKKLKVLKLQHNKVSAFQSLRLLTYNSALSDVCLEDNPIVEDPYFKVKLINCIPNLKYLDGTTVWRRTSLQSRIVNDDLKYADLHARTPSTVQKFANLSKRSGHAHRGDTALLNLSSSMLTMQGLRNHHSQSSARHTGALPEQTPLPPGIAHLSSIDAANRDTYSHNSPKRRHQRPVQSESSSDIALLPAYLQSILHQHQRAHASPRRSQVSPRHGNIHSASTTVFSTPGIVVGGVNTVAAKIVPSSSGAGASPWCAADAFGAVAEAPPRSRSALPWRNPPSITPNLDVHFKTRQRYDADSRSVTTSGDAASVVSSGAVRANSVTKISQQRFNTPNSRTTDTFAAQVPSSGQVCATPSPKYAAFVADSVSPHPSLPAHKPIQAASSVASNQSTAHEQSHWMNPELNSVIKTRTSAPLDSHLMENAMNSSLFVLQQSFDADKRVRSENGSVASSSITRGRPRARHETNSGSDAGSRSLHSTTSRGALRAVTPTKSSIRRANYTTELMRAQQDADFQARVLAEARTYTRKSPSRSPQRGRNPAYTYLQGTSSPGKVSEDGIPSYSVRTQPFSPQPSKKASSSYRSRSPYRESQNGSPPRESSTARILEMYRDMPEREGYGQTYATHQALRSEYPVDAASGLQIKVPAAAAKHIQNPPGSQALPPSSKSAPPGEYSSKQNESRTKKRGGGEALSSSDESKESPSEQRAAPLPPPSHTGSESPYDRFLRLRERLSKKYVQSEADVSEYFEPVRSSSTEAAERDECSEEEFVEGKSVQGDHDADQMTMQGPSHGHSPRALQQSSVLQFQSQVSNVSVRVSEEPKQSPPVALSFEQLKEQFQRQYQADYDKQRQEHAHSLHAKSLSPKTSYSLSAALTSSLQSALTSTLSATATSTPGSTSSRASTPSRGAADLPTGSVVAPQTMPPRGSGYEALYDLIHQRRSVLEKITQPTDLSPERGRLVSPERERIGGVISNLKQRQSASVSIIQSATRERTVPAPVHNGLLQVSLSTPALYPSINNYAFMAQAAPPHGALGATPNSFMNRLTSNNPYMSAAVESKNSSHTPGGNTSTAGSRFEGVTNLAHSYPAPPPYVPHVPQLDEKNAAVVSSSAPVHVVAAASMGGGADLARAIRDLQAKQTRDLSALKTH